MIIIVIIIIVIMIIMIVIIVIIVIIIIIVILSIIIVIITIMRCNSGRRPRKTATPPPYSRSGAHCVPSKHLKYTPGFLTG